MTINKGQKYSLQSSEWLLQYHHFYFQESNLYLLASGEAIDSNDLQRLLRVKSNRIFGTQSSTLSILVLNSCLPKIQETMLRPTLVTRLNNIVTDSKRKKISMTH